MKLLLLSLLISTFTYAQHDLSLNLEEKIIVVKKGCYGARGANSNGFKCYYSALDTLTKNPDIKIAKVVYLMCTSAADSDGGTNGYDCFKYSTITLNELTSGESVIQFILDTCSDVADDNHSGYNCFKSSYRKLSEK